MQHIYHIKGMTCNSCRSKVEQLLQGIKGITNARVNLEKEEATLDMTEHIKLENLQKALPDKYQITEKKSALANNTWVEDTNQSELRQLFPLFLIFFYIGTAAILMNLNPWNGSAFMLDFMGLFYIVFSFFKLLDLKGFAASFKMYDPLAKRISFYGWLYPFLELGLGLLFLFRYELTLALIATIVLLGITTVGVLGVLLDKRRIQCACLGTALKLPMTKATLIENGIMLVMAIWMLISSM